MPDEYSPGFGREGEAVNPCGIRLSGCVLTPEAGPSWIPEGVLTFYLIYESSLESQLPHKIVSFLFTTTN